MHESALKVVLWFGLAVWIPGCAAQRAQQAPNAALSAQKLEATMTPDELKRKIAQYAPTRISFDSSRLSAEQRQAVRLLVQASQVIDALFWQQASPEGPALKARLEASGNETERLLADYLAINYGAYDRLDDMRPFVRFDGETRKKPLGATFYPLDMSKDEFLGFLEQHPEQRPAFQSNFTVIRRRAGKLAAVPYSEFYGPQLREAADLLRQAADRVGNDSLARFLRSRADAFLSNDYFASDVDWMDVQDSPLEVTIGPYEVYEDRLFNYKAAFESFVTLRDPAESDKLAMVSNHLISMEKNLPIPDEHKNFKRGSASPVVVADLIFSAGDTRAGVQTLAFNLPNDERVREKKGCKKVMLKNVSHAKFDQILVPIARRVLADEQQDRLSFDGYFNHTLMHEVSHGLGPGFIEVDGQRTTVNLLLKDLYSAIEEAKADTLGVYNTLYLVDQGVLPGPLREQCLVTFLAGVFRSVRFGVHESHGQANMLIFNYLWEHGAYRYDPAAKRFSVDLARAPAIVRDLAREILMVQARGDYAGAQDLLAHYGQIKPEMQALLDSLGDIPVDIRPIFEIEQELQ